MLQRMKMFNRCATFERKTHRPSLQLRNCTLFISNLVELGNSDCKKVSVVSTINTDLFAQRTFTLQKCTNSTIQVKSNTKTSLCKIGLKQLSRDRSIHLVSKFKRVSQERFSVNQSQGTADLLQQDST